MNFGIVCINSLQSMMRAYKNSHISAIQNKLTLTLNSKLQNENPEIYKDMLVGKPNDLYKHINKQNISTKIALN